MHRIKKYSYNHKKEWNKEISHAKKERKPVTLKCFCPIIIIIIKAG